MIQCKAGMGSSNAEAILDDLVKKAKKKYLSIKGIVAIVITGFSLGRPVLIDRIVRGL